MIVKTIVNFEKNIDTNFLILRYEQFFSESDF